MKNTSKPVSISLTNFTKFKAENITFSTGMNLFIGKNGSGKTHILQLIYAIIQANNNLSAKQRVAITATQKNIFDEIMAVFKTKKLEELISFNEKSSVVGLKFPTYTIKFNFTKNSLVQVGMEKTNLPTQFIHQKIIFIPAKEFLSHAKGFRWLYRERELNFDKTFDDLCGKLDAPLLKKPDPKLKEILEQMLGGKIEKDNNNEFSLITKEGNTIHINLVAEGLKKIGMLYYLLMNGSINENTVLFWDEPEANLHPKLIIKVVELLIIFINNGMQVFIATHSPYIIESLNSHLQRNKINNLVIESEKIKNFKPLHPDKTQAYLLEQDKISPILDQEVKLIDDKLLNNFNDIGDLYDVMRDIEWDQLND